MGIVILGGVKVAVGEDCLLNSMFLGFVWIESKRERKEKKTKDIFFICLKEEEDNGRGL